MEIHATVTPELEAELVRRAPWMHPYKLGDDVFVGRFKDRLETTVVVSGSARPAIDEMRAAFAAYMDGEPYWNLQRALELAGAGGKSVLDIASATGRYSFAAALAGACDVLGVEIRPEQVEQAELIRSLDGRFGSVRFEHEPTSADDPSFRDGETYDVVLSMGLLYHLTDPVAHLRNVRRLARGAAVVETLTHAEQRGYWFLELEDPAGLTKAWHGVSWIPHHGDVPELLRRVGFSSVEVVERPAVAELRRWDERRPGLADLVLPGAAVKVLHRRRSRAFLERLRALERPWLSPRYYTYLARV